MVQANFQMNIGYDCMNKWGYGFTQNGTGIVKNRRESGRSKRHNVQEADKDYRKRKKSRPKELGDTPNEGLSPHTANLVHLSTANSTGNISANSSANSSGNIT